VIGFLDCNPLSDVLKSVGKITELYLGVMGKQSSPRKAHFFLSVVKTV
jgi:hypothetical protein